MIKVYCDNGAFKKELISLEKQGVVEVVMFPYENLNRKIRSTGLPSEATFADLDNFTWGTLPGTFGDYAGSDKYTAIMSIIGRQHRRDVLHLDSAYKSECRCFLTRDKTDIYANQEALSNLLGLKIYHSDDDWENFLVFVNEHRELDSSY